LCNCYKTNTGTPHYSNHPEDIANEKNNDYSAINRETNLTTGTRIHPGGGNGDGGGHFGEINRANYAKCCKESGLREN
jgi:hypothetical protein